MSLDADTRNQIENLLKQHHVVLFMKGTPQMPRCGFSAAASSALGDILPEYHSVDVLENPALREGIKLFGDWPTIPQLYVDGELVGGADIVRSMYASGELHGLFGVEPPDRTPPQITITDAAAQAIQSAMRDAGDVALHMSVSADHNAQFQMAPAGEHDIVSQANGIEIHLDPGSARRADGVTIDWVETVQGAGLSLSFPGAGQVRPISVSELKQRLDAGSIRVIDVRSAPERAKAGFASATVLEEHGMQSLAAMPKDTPLAFLCHHGNASLSVAQQFAAHGFSEIYNIEGGIEAWSAEIDDSVPRY